MHRDDMCKVVTGYFGLAGFALNLCEIHQSICHSEYPDSILSSRSWGSFQPDFFDAATTDFQAGMRHSSPILV